jgi:hypothetical protein
MRRYYAAIFCLSLSLATACQAAAQASQPTNSKAATQPASVAPGTSSSRLFRLSCLNAKRTNARGVAVALFGFLKANTAKQCGASARLRI